MRDGMKELGKRLRNARIDARVTQQQLADHLGASKQLVSHHELGRSTITVADLIKVAQFLGVSFEYLATGIANPGGNVRIVAPQGRAVPKLNADQIVAYARGKLALEDVEGRHLTASAVGKSAFALVPPDRGIFADNNNVVVTIDPDQQPQPGDVTLWVLGGGEVVLGRFRPGGGAKRLEPPFVIRFDNDDFQAREVGKADRPIFLGVKVEHATTGSR